MDIRPQPRYCGDEFHQADALTFPLEGFEFIWASPPCQAFTALRFMPDAKEHPNLIPETRARLVAAGVPYCIENVEGAPLGASGHLIMLCGTMFGLRTKDGRAELRRHRLFETSFSIPLRPACQHGHIPLGVYGGHVRDRCRKVLTVVGHTPVDNTGRSVITVTGDSVSGKTLKRPGAISVVGHSAPSLSDRPRAITGATPQTNTVHNRIRETFSVEDARQAMGIDWMPMSALSQAIPPAYSEFIGQQVMQVLRPPVVAFP